MYDNFHFIKDGTYKEEDVVKKTGKHLTRTVNFSEEKMVDYLTDGRIPSLLEFLENKIHLRQSMGVSFFEPSVNAPQHKQHHTPRSVRQEENLITQMKEKDKHHSQIVF